MESITFNLPAPTLDALKEISERDKISISQILRAAIVKEVHRRKPEEMVTH
ncbi:ribbon-helix-helix protein, CopG family [Aliiroseovarius sp.]|uniref:ribbon-helix-helix protein, CopG family n=1 Tax=Aliiroseovarius sp. TaxID=1872442 RepID=UPI003BABF7B2